MSLTGRPSGRASRFTAGVAALALAVGMAAPMGSAAANDEIESLKQAVDELNRRIQEIEQREAEKEEVAEETDWRVDELETAVDRIDDQVGSRAVVNAFDAVKLDFGGFLDLSASHIRGDNDSVTTFNRQVAELLIRAKLEPNIDLFLAQSFLRKEEPDFSDPTRPEIGDLSDVDTDTVLAWANYRYDDLLQVQAGRFLTPHGIVNIDHFPAVLLDPDQPQFLRPFGGQTIFPNFSNGLQVHGGAFLGGGLDADRVGYNLYAGSFSGNATDFNFGGRLQYTLGGTGLTVGANATYGERDDDTPFDTEFFVYGADLKYDFGRFLWENEIFVTDEDVGDDRFAAYTQPAWRFSDQWTGFYRFDYLDAGSDPVSLENRGISIEHAFGLSYTPSPRVHLRAIGRVTEFGREETAETGQLSATFSF